MWVEIPHCAAPRGLEKELPVYEVIKEYLLKLGDENLSVSRVFALSCGEFLKIFYSGKNYLEEITIQQGKITDVQSKLVEKLVAFPSLDLPEEELLQQLGEFFSQSKAIQNPPTYRNIKRFERNLRELPWQQDLSAVYKGSGVFRP
jgi:hypothetical protein